MNTTNVDGKAFPGSKPAKRTKEVNVANVMPDEHQPQSQQRQLHCKRSQHNKNVERNISSAHGVPLKGEWSMCVSSRVIDSKDRC